jgi:hypothetical protein
VAPIVHTGQLEGYRFIARLQVGHVSSPLFRNDFSERVMIPEDVLPPLNLADG